MLDILDGNIGEMFYKLYPGIGKMFDDLPLPAVVRKVVNQFDFQVRKVFNHFYLHIREMLYNLDLTV